MRERRGISERVASRRRGCLHGLLLAALTLCMYSISDISGSVVSKIPEINGATGNVCASMSSGTTFPN